MKKILIVTNSLNLGGVERLVINMSKWLAADGEYNIYILNLSGTGEFKTDALADSIHYVELNQKIGYWDFFSSYFAIRKLFGRIDPDVVITHQFASDLYASAASIGMGAKIICYLHNPLMEKISRRIIRWMLGLFAIDKFIITTEEIGRHLKYLNPNKLYLLYNAVNPCTIITKTKDEVWRDLGVERGQIIVGAIGRLSKEKGFDVLIRSFIEVSKNIPSCHLLIIGDGTERGRLEQLIDDNNLNGRVILAGYRPNIGDYLSVMNLLVISSRIESFSLAALEGMASRVPVLLSRRVMSMNLFLPAVAVADFTAGSFAKEITRVLTDNEEAAKMVRLGEELIKNKFSPRAYIKRLKEIID